MKNTDQMTPLEKRTALRSLVQTEMKQRGCSYEDAYATIATLEPELLESKAPSLSYSPGRSCADSKAMMANDSGVPLSNSEQIQKLVKEYCSERNLDVSRLGIYTMAFNVVLSSHPELVGHSARTPGIGWKMNSTTGKLTPIQAHSGTEGRSQSFQKAGVMGAAAENPAERAARLGK